MKTNARPNYAIKPKQGKALWTQLPRYKEQFARDRMDGPPTRKPATSARRKRVSPISKSRRKLLQEDAQLLETWWRDPANRLCAACGKPAEERHHSRGKDYKRLALETRWWVPICRECHDDCKRIPEYARCVIVFKGTPREQPLLALSGQWGRVEP